MARKFYLHRRKNVWYCEIVDPETGRRLTAKSTHCIDRDSAVATAAKWLTDGIPTKDDRTRPVTHLFTFSSILDGIKTLEDLTTEDAEKIAEALKRRGLLATYAVPGGKGSELLSDYLEKFWNFDDSPYIRDKLAHGHSITRGHCKKSLERVVKYWKPYFQGKRLAALKKIDLKNFGIHLTGFGLQPATVNRIMVLGKTALKWAFDNDLIIKDITTGISTFSGAAKKRGVL